MANKVTIIHVKDCADAFNVAARFMPGDWEEDRQASARAGYPVYRCYGDGLYYNYICDLGDRLEVNLGDGSTVNVWIDEDAEEDFTAAPAAAAAPAARRFSIRTRRGLRMICREKHTRTRGLSFDGSSVVLVQKWDVLRDGSIYARTLQGFFGPARRCGSWSEYVQQQRGYVLSIRREVAALVSICGGEVA